MEGRGRGGGVRRGDGRGQRRGRRCEGVHEGEEGVALGQRLNGNLQEGEKQEEKHASAMIQQESGEGERRMSKRRKHCQAMIEREGAVGKFKGQRGQEILGEPRGGPKRVRKMNRFLSSTRWAGEKLLGNLSRPLLAPIPQGVRVPPRHPECEETERRSTIKVRGDRPKKHVNPKLVLVRVSASPPRRHFFLRFSCTTEADRTWITTLSHTS